PVASRSRSTMSSMIHADPALCSRGVSRRAFMTDHSPITSDEYFNHRNRLRKKATRWQCFRNDKTSQAWQKCCGSGQETGKLWKNLLGFTARGPPTWVFSPRRPCVLGNASADRRTGEVARYHQAHHGVRRSVSDAG